MLPAQKTLADGTTIVLDRHTEADDPEVRALLNGIIAEGTSYPQDRPLDPEGFRRYWLQSEAFTLRAGGELVAAFSLRPNHPGRCSHIANGGFIVDAAWRGRGLGRWMGEAMIALATAAGYRAIQFNLVFAINTASLKLARSLGFVEIGRIPQAVQLPAGDSCDALILYRALAPASDSVTRAGG